MDLISPEGTSRPISSADRRAGKRLFGCLEGKRCSCKLCRGAQSNMVHVHQCSTRALVLRV